MKDDLTSTNAAIDDATIDARHAAGLNGAGETAAQALARLKLEDDYDADSTRAAAVRIIKNHGLARLFALRLIEILDAESGRPPVGGRGRWLGK